MNNQIRLSELRAVERGVALLDSVEPKWFKKINPRNFNLGDSAQCVLGHVYGDYFNGLKDLATTAINMPLRTLKFEVEQEATITQAARLNGKYYGFEVVANTNVNAAYERVGQAWLAVVRRREAREKRQRAAKRG